MIFQHGNQAVMFCEKEFFNQMGNCQHLRKDPAPSDWFIRFYLVVGDVLVVCIT